MKDFSERVPFSDHDNTLSDFHYSEEERVEMRKILTEQEIDEREAHIRSLQNSQKLQKERGGK